MQGRIKECMVDDAICANNLLESVSKENGDSEKILKNILYKRLLDMVFMLNSNYL